VVSPASHRISRARWYSGAYPGSRSLFAYRALTFFGRPFQAVQLRDRFLTSRPCGPTSPTTRPKLAPESFGLFPVRSPLLRESLLISFPPGTEMFHFPGLSPAHYEFIDRFLTSRPRGFPHSDISGSMAVCASPKLIAAYHVLHQRRSPRHPPYALCSLAISLNPSDIAAGQLRISSFSRLHLQLRCLTFCYPCNYKQYLFFKEPLQQPNDLWSSTTKVTGRKIR
jgi:hypothetical protein